MQRKVLFSGCNAYVKYSIDTSIAYYYNFLSHIGISHFHLKFVLLCLVVFKHYSSLMTYYFIYYFIYYLLSTQCYFVCCFSQIAKFGDPNGIVQFTEQDLRERVYTEPADHEGPLNISLLITRREGVMGNITVRIMKTHRAFYKKKNSKTILFYVSFLWC